MEKAGENLVYLLSAIIGVAILAVLVSKGAQTATVISSTFSGFSQVLAAAVAPVTGGASSIGGVDTLSQSGLSLLQNPANLSNAINGIFGTTTTTNNGQTDAGWNGTPINYASLNSLFGNSANTDSESSGAQPGGFTWYGV